MKSLHHMYVVPALSPYLQQHNMAVNGTFVYVLDEVHCCEDVWKGHKMEMSSHLQPAATSLLCEEPLMTTGQELGGTHS
jgi:hypothetical protein